MNGVHIFFMKRILILFVCVALVGCESGPVSV